MVAISAQVFSFQPSRQRFPFFPLFQTPYLPQLSLAHSLTAIRRRRLEMTTVASTNTSSDQQYDRATAVKQFDESKIGVKGLVDAGVTTIPPFFIHAPENLPKTNPSTASPTSDLIPIVDLTGVDSDRRSLIVEQIRDASRDFGFFQVINHGVPSDVINRTIDAIKGFHGQPTEEKSKYYSRERRGVAYSSNFDLFKSKAASWRDTVQMRLSPTHPDLELIPEIFRHEALEWDERVKQVGEVLMGILSEGLGLKSEKLKELTCSEARVMVAHYYPYCPQPDLTLGITSHTDPGVLTLLLQNQIGGLQVKYGDEWLDVKPVPDAIVINIGDILQILSNDEYKSVEHRVLANPRRESRVSIAIFFNPSRREDLYGPLPELTSPEKPALFHQFTLEEFMNKFFTKELDSKSMINFFKL